MTFCLDPSYHTTDAGQMLTGYDFSELELQLAKDSKEEADATKAKALADLGKPKAPTVKKIAAKTNTENEDDSEKQDDTASLQNIWNDVDNLGNAS